MSTTNPETDGAAVVRRFFTEQDAGNLAIIDELASDDFRCHVAGAPGPLDKEGLRGFSAAFYGAFPDLRHTFLRQVAADGMVASHVRVRGTHRAPFQGAPATGTEIDVTGMQFTRVEDGRLVEHWTVIDQLSLLTQVGAIDASQAEHPNRALFVKMYDAFTHGDMDSLAGHFSPDIVWHTAGHNPLAGTYQGAEATLASFVQEFQLSSGTYATTARDVLVSDAHIVALLNATAQRGGRTMDEDYVIVFTVRDGLVTEAWESWRDQPAVDRFWST